MSQTLQPSPIVTRLLRKRDLLLRDDPAHAAIKTALVVSGGGMRGAYTGGAAIALHRLGLTHAFDHLIGVSSGAAACAYLLSGQPELGTSLYYEEFASKRFINPSRLSKIMDIDYLAAELRYGKPLDVEKLRSSRSQLLIGATNVSTGTCTMLDAKSPSIDIITAIAATCSVPGISRNPVPINDTPYTDGIVSCVLPVSYAVDTLHATDILIILTNPFGPRRPRTSLLEKLLVSFTARHMPKEIRTAYHERNIAYNESISLITRLSSPDSGINIGVIAPASLVVKRTTIDPVKLRLTAQQGATDTMRFFGSSERIGLCPTSSC